jgi:hypothetical protein
MKNVKKIPFVIGSPSPIPKREKKQMSRGMEDLIITVGGIQGEDKFVGFGRQVISMRLTTSEYRAAMRYVY